MKKQLINIYKGNSPCRANKITAQNLPVLNQKRQRYILLTGCIDRLNTPNVNTPAGFSLLIHGSHPNALQRSSERVRYILQTQITCVRIPELYSSSLSSTAPTAAASLFTPVSLCQRLLSARRLRRCSHQTSAHLFVTAGWKRIFGLVGIFLFWPFLCFVKNAWSTMSGQRNRKRTCFSETWVLSDIKSQRVLQRTVFFSWFSSGVLSKGRKVGMNDLDIIDIKSFGLNNTHKKSILSTVTPTDWI